MLEYVSCNFHLSNLRHSVSQTSAHIPSRYPHKSVFYCIRSQIFQVSNIHSVESKTCYSVPVEHYLAGLFEIPIIEVRLNASLHSDCIVATNETANCSSN